VTKRALERAFELREQELELQALLIIEHLAEALKKK
jgi:hypothetical protein